MNIYEEIIKLIKDNISFAIASIIESKGSTPRHIGKMIVKPDGSITGTVGGGPSEFFIIQEAVGAIKSGHSKVVNYVLNAEDEKGLNMNCGGELTVFIEVVEAKPKLILIGAGHVGQATARIGESVGYQIIVIDDRTNYADENMYPMASAIYLSDTIDEAIDKALNSKMADSNVIDNNSYLVIATKDADGSALRKVINSDAAYVGMIGSKRKVKMLLEEIAQEGVSKEKLKQVYAPIGLDIGSETPEEIAVSIMSEIMRVRSKSSGQSLSAI
jgi:xanthine dehydrogenase accessory factor